MRRIYIMKKVLSLLLVFLMLVSFSACVSGYTIVNQTMPDNAPDVAKPNPEQPVREPEINKDPYVSAPDNTPSETTDEEKFDAVTKVVDSYYDAVISLDSKRALSYTKQNSEAYNAVIDSSKELDFSGIYNSVPNYLKSPDMTKVIDEFVGDVKNIISARASHAVRKISITNNTQATVYVEESVPEKESVANIDLGELFHEDRIVSYFLNSLNDAEYERFLSMNEAEATSLMLKKMPKVMKSFFDDYVTTLTRQIRTQNGVSVYTLHKVNGNWLIVSVEEGELE